MWINIEVVPGNEEIIYLPQPMVESCNTEVNVSFGIRAVTAKVEPVDDMKMDTGNDFANPLKIRLSSKLASRLLVIKTLTYQMKYDKENILIGPVIGLLLGDRNHLYSPRHMEKYSDRFGIYDQVGGLIYAFSPRAIDWENLVAYGLYYNYKESKWLYGRFPLPSSIYRRDFHSNPIIIKRLIDITNGKMFNSWRFTKFFLYQYVKRNKELSMHLPQTQLSNNYEQVKKFIDNHKNVILKPVSLSRGRGICIIKKDSDHYRVSDYRRRTPLDIELTNDESLKNFFETNKGLFNGYLIQKHLSLAKIDGSLFDIRIVMQKERPSEWKCTGIECRVAAKESLLTNISRGGYALTIDEALKKAFPDYSEDHERIKKQLDDLCHKLCETLDGTGHHFAEFGIDIALDEDRNQWIIESNVFPSFKGFKVMDYEKYLSIRYTPIFYASHIAGF